jgi:cell division protein FtsI (penicillin-binding protein 3)
MGFMPVANPELVIVVTLNGTTGNAGFGASAAGPVFNIVAEEALRVLDVPKDLPEAPEKPRAKPDAAESDDLAIADLDPKQPNILEDDESPAQAPAPVAGSNVQTGPRVPNFVGKTVRQVVEMASTNGIPVILDGSGIVRDQMPPAGEVLPPGQKVKVDFAR